MRRLNLSGLLPLLALLRALFNGSFRSKRQSKHFVHPYKGHRTTRPVTVEISGLVRINRGRITMVALLAALIVSALLFASCGGRATSTPTSVPRPSPTPIVLPTPTSTISTIPTPTIEPTPRPTQVVIPTATPQPTPRPTVAPTPTSTPEPTPEPTPTPVPQITQSRDLLLQVSSPAGDLAVSSPQISVSGVTSPDATVSVNGQLATVEATGKFSINGPILLKEGPNLIEVIASDLAGGVRSQVYGIVFTEQQRGILGQVTEIRTPSPGLTVISVDTVDNGTQQIEASENSAIIVPGKETASVNDISVGNFLAVLAAAEDSRLIAQNIMVKPDMPVVHAHIIGSKVGGVGDQIILMNRDGNSVAADISPDSVRIDPGRIVTAVVRQDLKTGALSLLAAEPVDIATARLTSALEAAARSGSLQNLSNLANRATADITGHLTILQEIQNRADPSISFLFTDALERAVQAYSAQLALFDLGKPTIRIVGRIEDIDRTQGLIFVSLEQGPRAELQLTDSTNISHFRLESPTAENLERAQEIAVLYEPDASQAPAIRGLARSVDVIFPRLGENTIASLLAQVGIGEVEGTVDAVVPDATPPTVSVTLITGRVVTLTTTPNTQILVGGVPAELADLVPLASVKVRHNASTREAVSIETFDESPDQTFITGIVRSFIPKFGENIPQSSENGNISITSIDGQTRTLIITENTIIERDGLRGNMKAISWGDIVRPVSTYDTQNREIRRISVRPPEFKGTIRGKVTASSGKHYLTVSTDQSNFITVRLVISDEEFEALQVGQRVMSTVYNPLTPEVGQLVVMPAKSIKATGTISALDKDKGVLTLAPATGEPIELLLPNKPGIVSLDGEAKSTQDLNVGDKVQAVFYRPDNKVVVSLVAESQ